MTHEVLAVEPWTLRETSLDLDLLSRTESLFALANGHVGVRGTLDEGEPHALPGTYLNSVHELRPLPYAETGFGYPESGQTVINVTNGKLVRLLVDDEPFDVRYGTLRRHERTLDFRSGLLERELEWESPAGQAVRVRSRRLVSFTQRAVLAVCYEVQALGDEARIVLQSELVANEQLPEPDEDDPRVAAALVDPLVAEDMHLTDTGGQLVHRVRHSGIRVSAAMDHRVEAPGEVDRRTDSAADWARFTATTLLQPGQTAVLFKTVAYGWSGRRSLPAVRDQVAAALTSATARGWEGLVQDQRNFLDEFWSGADVEVDGDPELQQAVRFGLFHVLQAGARAERRPLSAKGLTGPGYDGHCFWDTETFVLSVLTRTAPAAARDALLWRHATLPLAVARAQTLGLRGSAFPWRTITGEECSGYWPAGTAAFHVTADIADAVVRYLGATGDEDFARGPGLELLVQSARLWRSLGHHDLAGRFRIDGVTGPDEYSALADNNVYTNLMAARNLRSAAELCARHPDQAHALQVDAEEMASWRDAASTMLVPYDETLGVHPQSQGFTEHQVWDFEATPPERYPLLLHYPYVQLYRKQVVKQADLVLALHLCGSAFTDEEKRRDVEYYERLTVRDSSLSASTQAVMNAEVGHLDLAFDYAVEAALMDLRDLNTNTRDGLHLASLAGGWIALVAGFGGLRDDDGTLRFRPRLPATLDRLAFAVLHHGQRLRVEVTHERVCYRLEDGPPLTITTDTEPVELVAGKVVHRPMAQPVALPPPSQPAGRAPAHRART
ncbi:MAG: family 65 glycosyl hydrolase [Actinomycetota bacterium]|nr:family 65 glycosyl hydrolase [Actinomycetota bacterium]